MIINIKNKILTIIFAFISILLIVLFLINWSYSITDIDADNYEAKLYKNKKSVWATNIENYIPSIDAECFSIRRREVFTLGQRYGIKIMKTNDLTFNINWNTDYGIFYSFESAPSDLEYKAMYKKSKDRGKIDVVIEIRIDSKFKDENALKIKEIIRELCEQNGFILKRTRLIYGSDIIIKETEDSFIIGMINSKYDDKNQPSHGLYLRSYSKKHLF